jgi:hypothetical protein
MRSLALPPAQNIFAPLWPCRRRSPITLSTFITYAKEKRATAMASPRDGVGGRLAASRFGASCCCSTRRAIWRLATWRCRGANVVASVAPYVAVAAVPFGRCPAPSHRHRLVDCWICPFRRCGPPIPMRAPRSESRLVFRPSCCAASSSSYFDAIALPRLVLAVPACRRVSSSSRRLFFKTVHIFIIVIVTSVSSGRQKSLSRPSLSLVSMGVRRPRRHHRPRQSAKGSPRRPTSAASTDVGVCARRPRRCHCQPPPLLGCAPEGRRAVAAGAQTPAVKTSAVN